VGREGWWKAAGFKSCLEAALARPFAHFHGSGRLLLRGELFISGVGVGSRETKQMSLNSLRL